MFNRQNPKINFTNYTMSFQLPSGLKPAQPPQQSGGGGGGGQDNGEAQEKQRQQEEMKRGMIASMLAPAARERCTYRSKVGADDSIENSVD